MSPSSRRPNTQKRLLSLLTYLALFVFSGIFILPFLWMLSSSFKSLDTIFEYPPSLIPTEFVAVERAGKSLPVADYSPPQGSPQTVLITDERPNEYQVEPYQGKSLPPTPDTQPPTSSSWVPISAVKKQRQVHIRFQNYREAWEAEPFAQFALNTVIITSFGIIGQVMSASLVAFAFARLEWPGRKFFFLLVLATMMLPSEVTMIPTYLIFRHLGWIDTFLPLIVPSFLGGGAFSIFLFRQFFLTLPKELDEAAQIDGCSSFGIYRHILMPLCKPIIATIAIFSFVGHWNDFLTPLIYLNSTEKFTLAIALRFFQGAYNTDMHLLMAASTLMLLPVILVFFLGQKHFVKSIVMSGTKG